MIKYNAVKLPINETPLPYHTEGETIKDNELHKRLSDETMMNKGMAMNALEGIKEVILREIANGNRVKIDGLGTFQPRLKNVDGKVVCTSIKFKAEKSAGEVLSKVECKKV